MNPITPHKSLPTAATLLSSLKLKPQSKQQQPLPFGPTARKTPVFGGLLNSLSSKVQGGLLVLGLAREAVYPGESQHVLHSVVDTQSAGVVERGAALVILAVQQGLHAVMLRLDAPETHAHTHCHVPHCSA